MKVIILQILIGAWPMVMAGMYFLWRKNPEWPPFHKGPEDNRDDRGDNDPNPRLPIIPVQPGTPLSEILVDKMEQEKSANQAAALWLN